MDTPAHMSRGVFLPFSRSSAILDPSKKKEGSQLKRIIAFSLAIALVLSLAACGKSKAAKSMDEMITNLGEITLDSIGQIEIAEEVYAALPEEDKADVENHAALVAARETYEKLHQQAIEDAFLDQICGKWVGIIDADVYQLERGGGSHDGIPCRFTVDFDRKTVTVTESADSLLFIINTEGIIPMLIPEGKDFYYVRPEHYDSISQELQAETTALLTSCEWWKAPAATNYISFLDGGNGWYLLPGHTLMHTWEFVDSNTIQVHIDHEGGQTITLDVVHDNGSKQLVDPGTGEIIYIPKQ